jgi:hypothetical protein
MKTESHVINGNPFFKMTASALAAVALIALASG